MFKLNKWYLTRSLPAFRDAESFTILEQTYKLYQCMEQFESEYNSFVDSFNAEWELFETKYNSDIEVFTLAMRQEFADFIEVVDLKITALEQESGANIQALQSEVNTIKSILTSDDVSLDTLQELVNALKNNVSSINDIFTELAKKVDKTTYESKVSELEGKLGNKVLKADFTATSTTTLKEFRDIILSTGINGMIFNITYNPGGSLIRYDMYTFNLGSNRYFMTDLITNKHYEINDATDSTLFSDFIANYEVSSGGGSKLYMHTYRFSVTNPNTSKEIICFITFISSASERLSKISEFVSLVGENNYFHVCLGSVYNENFISSAYLKTTMGTVSIYGAQINDDGTVTSFSVGASGSVQFVEKRVTEI